MVLKTKRPLLRLVDTPYLQQQAAWVCQSVHCSQCCAGPTPHPAAAAAVVHSRVAASLRHAVATAAKLAAAAVAAYG
jgi:hypothetical protein